MQILGVSWQQWKYCASASPPHANMSCGSLYRMILSIVLWCCLIQLDHDGANMLEYRGRFHLTVLWKHQWDQMLLLRFSDNPIKSEVTQQRCQNPTQFWTGWQCSCTALKVQCEYLELFRLICKLSHPACSGSHCAATPEIKSTATCYSIELQRHQKSWSEVKSILYSISGTL